MAPPPLAEGGQNLFLAKPFFGLLLYKRNIIFRRDDEKCEFVQMKGGVLGSKGKLQKKYFFNGQVI